MNWRSLHPHEIEIESLRRGRLVGFVNAAESKEALSRQNIPFIISVGPKGVSAVAASIINALAIMVLGERPA